MDERGDDVIEKLRPPLPACMLASRNSTFLARSLVLCAPRRAAPCRAVHTTTTMAAATPKIRLIYFDIKVRQQWAMHAARARKYAAWTTPGQRKRLDAHSTVAPCPLPRVPRACVASFAVGAARCTSVAGLE